MRYLYISTLASKENEDWKKGDRILVEINDECFLGTVTSVRQGKINLLCDDGDKHQVSVGSKRILGEGIKRKIKKPISKTEIDKYLKYTSKNTRKTEKPISNNEDNPYNRPSRNSKKPPIKISDKPKKVSFSNLKLNEWYNSHLETSDGEKIESPCIIVYKNGNKVYALFINKEFYEIELAKVIKDSISTTLPSVTIYKYSNVISNSVINAYMKYCNAEYGKDKSIDPFKALKVAQSVSRLAVSSLQNINY